MTASSKTTPAAELERAVATAVAIAGGLGVPVIASTVALPAEWELSLIPPLRSFEPIVRGTPGMLEDPRVRQAVEGSGRSVLAIGGVSSEIAVLHSGLGALRRGYEVHVLVDCCGGLSSRGEDAAFRQLETAGAVMSSVSSFFTSLVDRMDDAAGRVVFASLAKHWSWSG